MFSTLHLKKFRLVASFCVTALESVSSFRYAPLYSLWQAVVAELVDAQR
jgi:hypothetical protein